jgi:hypothetical protein
LSLVKAGEKPGLSTGLEGGCVVLGPGHRMSAWQETPRSQCLTHRTQQGAGGPGSGPCQVRVEPNPLPERTRSGSLRERGVWTYLQAHKGASGFYSEGEFIWIALRPFDDPCLNCTVAQALAKYSQGWRWRLDSLPWRPKSK